jgi:uroporphyrinogen decarboxylase
MVDQRARPKLLRVLDGEAVWPPPVWLMRQAGRYLPEYRKIRAAAGNFIALCTTPALATEVTLQPIRRFGFDAAILFSDILILPWAMGQGLRFAEGEGPRLDRIEDQAGLDRLRPDALRAATESVMETVSRVRAELPPEVALIGFAGGPFTVACYMIDGQGGDFLRTRILAYANPGLLAGLISKVTLATIDYLSFQIEAGADCVMLFDSWAGLLPPDLFRTYVIAPTAQITKALKDRHPGLRVIGFPRLAGLMAIEYAAIGIDGLGMDTTTDPATLARLAGSRIALQGNLDPLLLRAGGPELSLTTRAIAQSLHSYPHIFNLGHGILPDTPPDHVAALIRTLHTLEQTQPAAMLGQSR